MTRNITFAGAKNRLFRFLKRAYATPSEVQKAEWIFYITYLKEGMTVFDVGAYVGETTSLFSKFVGSSGRVHSFEASKASFERLSTVCGAIRSSNVTLNHLAVFERPGMVKLYEYDEENMSLNTLARRPLQDYGIDLKPVACVEVTATSIDFYCESTRIPHIDLLKIDVEGAEFQVLRGARRMLENRLIRCCVFEFGQTTFDMGNRPEELERFLNGMGYEIRNVVSSDPPFPGRQSPLESRFSVHIAVPRD